MDEIDFNITNTQGNEELPQGPAALHSVTALSGMLFLKEQYLTLTTD
jgi:hypothetical protein